jgi:hypothetical protein
MVANYENSRWRRISVKQFLPYVSKIDLTVEREINYYHYNKCYKTLKIKIATEFEMAAKKNRGFIKFFSFLNFHYE